MPKQSNTPPPAPAEPVIGKGVRTPTRREREAANKRPLVPTDRKEARRQSRSQLAVERDKARIGMANGDERYLMTRDKGPTRRFVRDYVDARTGIGEAFMPVLLIFIVMTAIPSKEVQFYGIFVVYAFLILVIIDSLILAVTVRRKVREKFGADVSVKGLGLYAAMRSVYFRRLRTPKPQVKRREFPS
ncbi:DUF3043 domain-containing protein [Naasia lichenicola]|uniref:DUF3043 domain-containing protein n=1 Tax=Naasia lichenicola TaxID=2565933 RepID=A0A4S4FT03_9MICO|nr:DUF3043 domain-containing protein [Naasia lichenicola]THG33448.1 DUF3043 domain-containing protein [Naasia lichenicola]